MTLAAEGLCVEPLPANGVVVYGLDAAGELTPAIGELLRALWLEHPIIHFAGAGSDPEAHVRLSSTFGRTDPHAIAAIRHPEHEKLIRLTFEADPEGVAHGASFIVDGTPAPGWLPWHKDGFFTQNPNHGSMLNPVRIAYQGGETAFIDTTQAYADLPEAMKRRIADLEIIFDPLSNDPPLPYGRIGRVEIARKSGGVVSEHARAARQTRIAQKLVAVHPVSGVTVLNLTALFAPVILGMERLESDALLRELLTFAEQPQYVYTHRWAPNDLLLWDNWRCLHSVCPHPADASREMHRSTIGSNAVFGRLLET